MIIKYQLAEGEIVDVIPYDRLDSELGAEMLIRTAHAMQFMAEAIWDVDAEVIEEVTGTTIVVFTPLEGRRMREKERMPTDIEDVEFSFSMTAGGEDPLTEYGWMNYPLLDASREPVDALHKHVKMSGFSSWIA